LPQELDDMLWRYLTMAANSLVNADTSGHPSTTLPLSPP
jgi:hypothetical protein